MLEIIEKEISLDINCKPLRAYWLNRCQKLIGSIRDEDGRRMVFNIPKRKSVTGVSEYVVVAACSDPDELSSIKHRLRGDIAGLERSIDVIDIQLNSVVYAQNRLDEMISGKVR